MVLFCFPGVASECGLLASLDFEDNYPPKDWLLPLVVTTKGPLPILRECTGLFCGWAEESRTTLPPLPTGVYGPYKEIDLLTEKEITGWWGIRIVVNVFIKYNYFFQLSLHELRKYLLPKGLEQV